VKQSVSKGAFRVSDDGKKLLVTSQADISPGARDPFEYQVTGKINFYLAAGRHDILVVAVIIFDNKTVWTSMPPRIGWNQR
jgi:hypothetical protein